MGWVGRGDELGAVCIFRADLIRASDSAPLSLVPCDHVCLVPPLSQGHPPPSPPTQKGPVTGYFLVATKLGRHSEVS